MQTDYFLIGFIAAVVLAVFMFEWGMVRSLYGNEAKQKERLKDRLDAVRSGLRHGLDSSLSEDIRRRQGSIWHRYSGSAPGIGSLILLVERSGVRMTVTQLVVMMLLLGSTLGLVAWIALHDIFYVLTLAIIGACAPVFILARIRASRYDRFSAQLPEAMDIMTRALRAGHPFNNTFQVVAEEMSAPISEEFAITYSELSYGLPMQTALNNLLQRMPSTSLKALVTSILVSRETGGNLAEVMSNISHVIRGGFKFQRKVRTLSAEGRMSAIILGSVPFVLGLMIFTIAPDIMQELFTNPRGHDLLKGSLVMYIIGYFWIRRIIRIDV